MLTDSLKIVTDQPICDSVKVINDQTTFGTPLGKILILVAIIIIGSLLYLAYHKWLVPEKVKNTNEYKENSYKDIDGC